MEESRAPFLPRGGCGALIEFDDQTAWPKNRSAELARIFSGQSAGVLRHAAVLSRAVLLSSWLQTQWLFLDVRELTFQPEYGLIHPLHRGVELLQRKVIVCDRLHLGWLAAESCDAVGSQFVTFEAQEFA